MIPVIIPTYKGEKRLPRVIECVNLQSEKAFPWIRDNNSNGIYYTRAINEGLLKYAFNPGVEFCLVLCDDVYMKPFCLSRLVECARRNPKAGIIAPIQKDAEGKITWAGSLWSWPMGAHMTDDLESGEYETPWASGAVFLVRTDMIKEIGLLDPNMRFICSDADYSFTARTRGWQIMVEPTAHVEHSFGGSKAGADPVIEQIKVVDALYFTRKWLSGELFRRLEYGASNRISDDKVREHERTLARHLESKELGPYV